MKHKLFIVSSNAANQKLKIMREIMDNEIISFTTRLKREEEIEGKDYYYITQPAFEQLLLDNALLEVTNYRGEFYGVTKVEVDNKLSKSAAFLLTNYNGMKQMKRNYANCTTIYIFFDSKSADVDEETETNNLYYYDHVITYKQGDLHHTLDDIRDILYDI